MSSKYSFGWKKIKQIKSKTNGLCAYCNNVLPEDIFHKDDGFRAQYYERIWHVDHVIPISKGGGNNIDNLVPACPQCNAKKTDMNVEDFMRIIQNGK